MANCFCCLYPWECGCEDVHKEIQTPEGYPEPPKNILCPCCNRRVNAVYVQADTYCACCFIPCPCCKCGQSPPELSCPYCSYTFPGMGYSECSQCHNAMGPGENFCNNCGGRKGNGATKNTVSTAQNRKNNNTNNSNNNSNSSNTN